MFKRLMRRRVFQGLLAPFGDVLEPDRWIFIVGCYNSGTTLLARVLASHPDVAGLPGEGVFYTDVLPHPEAFGWTRMWCRCQDSMRLAPEGLSGEKVDRIKRQWSLLYPRRVPNLLDKSVANTTRMPFLQRHFAPAHFVHIVRNGYAVAEGIRRKGDPRKWGNLSYPDGYPISLAAEQWVASNEVVERDAPRLERFHQLTYEELTADPDGELAKLTDFLGIVPLPRSVSSSMWELQGRTGRIENQNIRSFRNLSPADLDEIEGVAGGWLERLNYPRPPVHAPA